MNFSAVHFLAAAALCCPLGACGRMKRPPVPKAVPVHFPKGNPADGKRRQIGTVLLVNGEEKFVLVDTRGWALPEAGMALKCLRDGADTGTLIVGGERQGSHVVADIVTGAPKRGDQVFQ